MYHSLIGNAGVTASVRNAQRHETLLALACGDGEAILEGLGWVTHFEQINPERGRVYRCIDTIMQLEDEELTPACNDTLRQLYGSAVVEQANALLDGNQRFFAAVAPGLSLKGCTMHQRLLEAYDKARKYTRQ